MSISANTIDASRGERTGRAPRRTGISPETKPSSKLPARARLKDGTRVRLRLIGPSDRERLLAGFQRLSPESRYWRFFSPMPRLPESLLARLLDTDEWNHLAIGAERDGRAGQADDAIVGVARYFRLVDEPDVAEVAVAVVDELHGLGLGRILLVALVDAARDRGIEKFRAQVLPGNERMKSILQDSGATPVARPGQGYVAYEVRLPQAKRYVFRRQTFYRAFKLVAERIGTATVDGLSAALRGALGISDDSAHEPDADSPTR